MSRLRFFDPYYARLGLSPGAGDAEIKSAYRRLAKQYHPDRSGTSDTREDFIAVNQAYEMLLKRDLVIRQALSRLKSKKAQAAKGGHRADRRRKDMAAEARYRAEKHAEMPFERFAKTPIYRTAMVVNSVFDYVAIGVGVLMVIAPIGRYFSDMTRLAAKGEEPDFHAVPIFIGLCFLYGVWYFRKNV